VTGPAGDPPGWPAWFARPATTLAEASPAPAPSGEDEWRRWLRDNGIDWDGEVA
jgi:hypothetical protein